MVVVDLEIAQIVYILSNNEENGITLKLLHQQLHQCGFFMSDKTVERKVKMLKEDNLITFVQVTENNANVRKYRIISKDDLAISDILEKRNVYLQNLNK